MNQEFTDLAVLLAFVQAASKTGQKAFYRLGQLAEAGTQLVATILAVPTASIQLLIDSDSIRHTLAQHGPARSKVEAARSQIPITEEAIEALATWLPATTIIRAGERKPGKQPRVELVHAAPDGTTVAIIEWRPGRRQLALVTLYKKGQPPKQLTFSNLSGEQCAAPESASPS